jgi:hypothetical protein
MSEESNMGLMLVIGKSLIDLGYVEPLDSIFDKIRGITAEELLEISNEVFDRNKMSLLTYLPD